MALEGIDHIDIVVRDPEAMASFLQRIGFLVHRRTEHGGGSIELAVPGDDPQPIIELTSEVDDLGRVRPLGMRHIAYRSSDLAATIAAFEAQGLSPRGEVKVVPATGRRLVNFSDPEGGSIQIVEAL